MHLGQLIDSLDFNDDGIGHDHVQAKCLIHLDAFTRLGKKPGGQQQHF